MIANAGLIIRPFVALVFLVAGLLLLRSSSSRAGGVLVTIGAAIFLAGELYGLVVLRPFIGRFYDDDWYEQIATVDAVETAGMLLCALGLLTHAYRRPGR